MVFQAGQAVDDAFKAYNSSITYSCDFEPAIVEALWKFVQSSRTGNLFLTAVQEFVKFLSTRFSREMMREWMVFSGVRRLFDVHGQGFKEKFISVFFDRVLQLVPEEFRDNVSAVLREPIRGYLSGRRNQEFIPTFTLDSALKLDRQLFTFVSYTQWQSCIG